MKDQYRATYSRPYTVEEPHILFWNSTEQEIADAEALEAARKVLNRLAYESATDFGL